MNDTRSLTRVLQETKSGTTISYVPGIGQYDPSQTGNAQGRAYAFHVGLIRHGREICRAQTPRCSACSLLDLCPRIGVTRSS